MDFQPTVETMRTVVRAFEIGDVRESLRAVQAAQDALDAVKASLLADLSVSKDFEIDGASTLNTWVRNELRLNAGQATTLVRNMTAMRDLPLVGEAALEGRISAAHVRVFAYGLVHVGLEPMRELEDVFVQVAKDHSAAELMEAVQLLKARVHPEDLDDAWERGMDKEDFQVDALPDGWHITGFLNTVTGAKLKKVLDSISAPRDADDTRTGSQRRVQGLDDLLSDILGSGLPSDKGVKPHMSVFADADTVAAAAERVKAEADDPWRAPDPMPPVKPATLAGHGHIGPHLLMYFLCISDVTAFLMKDGGGRLQDQVLNVGRTHRLATDKQRRAVIARQTGICAAPGCNHTHLEIHHSIWFSKGGATDLDLLVGLCTRCHHLVHHNRLRITGDAVTGFTFTTATGKTLRRRRTGYHPAA